jgi:hypothetical protein
VSRDKPGMDARRRRSTARRGSIRREYRCDIEAIMPQRKSNRLPRS